MVHVVFAIPFIMENTLRFARAASTLPDVKLSVVSQDAISRLPADFRERLVGFEQVADGMSAEQIAEAVSKLEREIGKVDRLLGILEQLQEPLAHVREKLSIRGMDLATSSRFRDKALMKEAFGEAGIPCAGHRLCASIEEATQFASEVGYPLVGKPPAGAGSKATARCNDEAELRQFVKSVHPAPGREVLFEEFVQGREFSFDSITLNGRHVFHNICCYYPTPLEVMDNPWIQWCVVLPRELDQPEFEEIHRVGPKALDALGMWTGMSHMEWFRRHDGSIAISEVAARPPGAQFVALMGHVLDVDMHRVFADLMVFERLPPLERRYSVGAAYLRGQAKSQPRPGDQQLVIQAVHGLEEVQREYGELVVGGKLPVLGAPQADTYEGDGFLIVRHQDCDVVRKVVQAIVSRVRVEVG
jgi:formate-dependent phosphoribosylglycinamide formyltransferase (GAR transformylase)